MHKPPTPYDDTNGFDPFWLSDREEWDKNLPSPGFVTDFVLALRGIETPTKFCAWTALFLIAAALKRDSWLKWYPSKLYANMYLFLVAPPRICAKSTALNWADVKVLEEFHKYIKDPILQHKKQMRVIHSKGTAEGLFEYLRSEERKKSIQLEKGELPERIEYDSDMAIIVSELSTFLGRQSYNLGLVEKLTDWYDCRDIDDQTTVSRKKKEAKNLHICLFGGTTPGGLQGSIPEEAFGDGFMSRVIMAFQEKSTRIRDKPIEIKGAPKEEELAKRLAWIAQNAKGEYEFSPEAEEAYRKWYRAYRKELESPVSKMHKHPRFDVHLRKVSLLIRANRYEMGKVIELQDFKEAKKILYSMLDDFQEAVQDVGATPTRQCLNKVEKLLKSHRQLSRRRLLTMVSSRGWTADIVSKAIDQLRQEGKVKVRGYQNKKELNYVPADGKSMYYWRTRVGEKG